jgi:hypothetical protein
MTNKDLIQQYVSTGLQLPEHQVKQLNTNQFKSYIRLRMITHQQGEHIEQYEFILAPNDVKSVILKSFNDEMDFGEFLAGKTKKFEDYARRRPIYKPAVDFKTIVKTVLDVSSEETSNRIPLKRLFTAMSSTPDRQELWNINTDKKDIFDLCLSSPDFGKDKNLYYVFQILCHTDTIESLTTFGKSKLDKYIQLLNDMEYKDKADKLSHIYNSTPIPEEIISLLNQYGLMGNAFLEWMDFDAFYDLLDTKNPLEKVNLIPEKPLKQLLTRLKKRMLGTPEEYAKNFTNPKEIMQILNKYS